MSARRTITSGIQTEETLRNLFNTFLSFSNDPSDNISKLIAGLGEMLNAASCLYNKLDDGILYSVAHWNTPPDFKGKDIAEGHICTDVLKKGGDDLILLKHLDKSPYAKTDPGVKRFGLKTYFGKIVELAGKPLGTICAVFTTDFSPTTEQEELIGIISSAISVQESLQQKIADIRDREHKLQTLIDNSPNVAIQFYDANGIVKYWNKASEVFYGFSEAETRGKSLAELILDEEGYKEFLQTLDRIDNTGETVRSEWTVTDKYGASHHIVSTLFAVHPSERNNGSKDFICMDVDLTELKIAETKLKDYTTQLENLNATKDKFFSIIAHDLKNPFNAILGFSRILYNDYQELNDDEILKFVRAIRDSSENAFKLLQNLLVWSRIQTGHMEFSPEICSLSLIVSETLALMKPQAITKNIHIVAEVEPALQVYADENMIKTILRNLVSNAIKYSHVSGRVEVKASDLGREVKVEISDNGIGMNPNLIARLFSVGESTERPGTSNEMGTGLGLILCREFLQQHKTVISVKSEEGKGSVFSFILAKYRMPS
jgi:PAS domain S-box-containing protein